jgi:predicted Zn-dependent peptidase
MNRSTAPTYSQPNQLIFDFPTHIQFKNGVNLYWLKDVKDNSVKLDLEWAAGSKYQKKRLVASFTNKLMLSGNSTKSAAQIAEEIDFYGGFFQNEIDTDHSGVSIYGLSEQIGNIFEVFSSAFLACQFPTSEFEKERTISLANFKIDSQKVKNICSRSFNKYIYGENSPYGQLAVESDFEALNREDVANYFNDYYLNAQPTLFLVGRVSDEFIQQIETWAQNFQAKKENFVLTNLEQKKGRIDMPVENSLGVQAAIRVGRQMFNKNHADYFNFQLMNTYLGGYFGSRLMTNIREDKGYTYGISSHLTVQENAASFIISTEVGTDVKEETIKEIFIELENLRTNLIPEDELQKVKNYMLGDFLRRADGPIALMENFKNIHFNQLKKTYYNDFIQAIHKASAPDLREVAQRYLQDSEMLIVTAG